MRIDAVEEQINRPVKRVEFERPYRQPWESPEKYRHVRPLERYLGVACGHHLRHLAMAKALS